MPRERRENSLIAAVASGLALKMRAASQNTELALDKVRVTLDELRELNTTPFRFKTK